MHGDTKCSWTKQNVAFCRGGGCITGRVSRDGDMKYICKKENKTKKKLKSGEGGQQASPRVKVNVRRKNSEGECSMTNSRSCVVNERSGRSLTEEDSEL